MAMITSLERTLERMQLYKNMMCEYDFDTIKCKACPYYYRRTNNMYSIPSCLKEQIKAWTLYRIEEGNI